ncbi:MAG TPA: TIGR02757 family protein [Deltaproteobacteria bacterium]|nr:TIGR02757 family protein [Deltaproteobacteria bacterium]
MNNHISEDKYGAYQQDKGLPANISRIFCDELYMKYNHRRFISPDPLEFVWRYNDPLDREIVGLLASALAYGRVGQIKKSISGVLEKMVPTPRSFIEEASCQHLAAVFGGFKHRFTTGLELADFILGIQRVILLYGSLYACFMNFLESGHENTCLALRGFADELRHDSPHQYNSLLPHPDRKSACKRLHLFLRWMVRRDDVDPGGWDGVSPALLIVPLDTHMYAICSRLGMTSCSQANLKTALEITEGFRSIIPDDPVKYDFALTRLGIRPDADRGCLGQRYP